MLNQMTQSLAAMLGRILNLDESLGPEQASIRLRSQLVQEGWRGLDDMIDSLAQSYSRRGVINPLWLNQSGIRHHFFLADGQAGQLRQIVDDAEEAREGLSQYVLYGQWDALMALLGGDLEADLVEGRIRSGQYLNFARVAAADVLIASGRDVRAPNGPSPQNFSAAELAVVNSLVEDFDDDKLVGERGDLLENGVLLGYQWRSDAVQLHSAFVGIEIRGTKVVEPEALLSSLRSGQPDFVAASIQDFYNMSSSQPFDYLLKLQCVDMDELDNVTNSIGFMRPQGSSLEITTLVVAAASEQPSTYRDISESGDIRNVGLSPSMSSIQGAMEKLFGYLSADEKVCFNGLDAPIQIAVLRSIPALYHAADSAQLSGRLHGRVTTALNTFRRECASSDSPNVTGAMGELATAVETTARDLLEQMAHQVFGRKRGDIQEGLRLPQGSIQRLSLGETAQAYERASRHDDFRPYGDILAEHQIFNLSEFTKLRNAWAHGKVDLPPPGLIDEAYVFARTAIDLLQWLDASAIGVGSRGDSSEISGKAGLQLVANRPKDSEFTIFISHSSNDRKIAQRVATGLRTFNYKCWYSDWELKAGDSFVEKIEASLAASDVLVVLLSQASVASAWVKKELDSFLVDQLHGRDVQIIPLLIEQGTPIPAPLEEIQLADFTVDFEDGFRELTSALRGLRNR